MKNVVIIDYGSGNIRSVFNAFKQVTNEKNYNIKTSSSDNDIKNASRLILPGVGSFESCITGLKNRGLNESLNKAVLEKKIPFLGICVGMQMLATYGFENGKFSGLGWIKGSVKKIKSTNKNLKIPHMGWNKLIFKKQTTFTKKLLKKINLTPRDEITAYFVHSYNFKTNNENEKILTTQYGQEITAMVSKDNIIGTQFHPEKSHYFGLTFLQTFIEQEIV